MDDPFIFIPALLVAICTTCLFVLILTSVIRKKVRTVQAEVVAKKTKRVYNSTLAKAGVSGSSWYEYYAVFKVETGKTIELQLPKDIYDIIEEGNKGQLTFKGYNFISFDKNSCFFV